MIKHYVICPKCHEMINLTDNPISRMHIERTNKNMTYRKLSEITGLTSKTIVDAENLRLKPHNTTAYVIAKALEYDGNPEDLFKAVIP